VTDVFVHPTAIVAEGALLSPGVKIGPYSTVGPEVVLGENVELVSHAVVDGRTTIGRDTKIYPFASVGNPPQDLKYGGELSRLEVGERCTIRESVTINPGTEGGGMVTRIGNDCLLMACAHVAHDCQVGNNVVLANYVGLAGHTIIGDHVGFGGLCGVRQFVRIGSYAFIGAHSMVDADVIPYGMAVGNRAKLSGLNLVGLKRRGFERDAIHVLRGAYRKVFFGEGTLRSRVDAAATAFADDPLVQDVVSFMRDGRDRAFCLPRSAEDDV
jgi:UDP-N-acetylglucosamine acyltransferase